MAGFVHGGQLATGADFTTHAGARHAAQSRHPGTPLGGERGHQSTPSRIWRPREREEVDGTDSQP
eukprot:303228-Karenia_brevis.AAC.1